MIAIATISNTAAGRSSGAGAPAPAAPAPVATSTAARTSAGVGPYGVGDWPDTGPDLGYDRDFGGPRGEIRGGGRGYGRDDYRGSIPGDQDRDFLDKAGDQVSSWFGDRDAERRRQQDRLRSEGEHRGRGPSGYRRSDERIREDVNDRLSDDSWIDASHIEVQVSNGEVTLNGTVHDRRDKRHAEDLAERVSGVSHVQNNLRVKSPTGGLQTSSSGQPQGAGAPSPRAATTVKETL